MRYDVAALVQALDDYPLLCLEQASSKRLPARAAAGRPGAGPDRAARLQAAVDDGARQAALRWRLRPVVGERARRRPGSRPTPPSSCCAPATAGAAVPDGALKDALKFLGRRRWRTFGDKPEELAARGLLPLRAGARRPAAGRARTASWRRAWTSCRPRSPRRSSARRWRCPTTGRAPRRPSPPRSPRRHDATGTPTAAARCATRPRPRVLLKESGLLPDRLAALLGRLPGADLRPRQAEHAGAGLGGGRRRRARPRRPAGPGRAWTARAAARAGGAACALTGPVDGAQPRRPRRSGRRVSATGVPADPPPAARAAACGSAGKFFTLTGDPLDLDHLKQNTVFVLLIEGRADDAPGPSGACMHAGAAGRLGDRRPAGRPARRAGHALARRADRNRGAAGGRRPLRRDRWR